MVRDISKLLPILGTLTESTYRTRAEAIIDRARKYGKPGQAVDVLEQFGWLAGGGKGDVVYAPGYIALPDGAVTVENLEGVYRRAYWLAQLQEQYPGDQPRPITKHGKADYAQSIRRPVYAYWAGKITRSQFIAELVGVIERGLNRAWREGASECGVAPDELTQAEKTELEYFINEQFTYVPGFADRIEAGSKANGGKYAALKAQVETWANRYDEAKARGQLLACADIKTKWVLGDAEHCSSCLKLSGKVKRNSYWRKMGILPRVAGADYLECRGFKCQCTLVPTNDPITPGPLPRLP